jgi:hypothetical protein
VSLEAFALKVIYAPTSVIDSSACSHRPCCLVFNVVFMLEFVLKLAALGGVLQLQTRVESTQFKGLKRKRDELLSSFSLNL